MRTRPGFVLQPFSKQFVAVSVEPTGLRGNVVVNLNGVGAFLWEQLQQDRTFDQLLSAMLDRFEVAPAQAQADLENFLATLRQNNLLIE